MTLVTLLQIEEIALIYVSVNKRRICSTNMGPNRNIEVNRVR